ncbi:hypothetical protein Cantr_09834 [Candida viswanathii]|uniref:Uncharacterized protein n=1 Tax=Candida viswanathii TaxID=5486 RepID=A0A367YEA6_9ASCO|nr:hypothetical protein Cantr_09834 [Candida viswanathii]
MIVTFKYNSDKLKRRSSSTSSVTTTPTATGRTTRRSSLNNSSSVSLGTTPSGSNTEGLTDHNLRSHSANTTPSKLVTLQYNNHLLTPTSRRTTRRQSQINLNNNSSNSNHAAITPPQTSVNSSPVKKVHKSPTPQPKTSIILDARVKQVLTNLKKYQDAYIITSTTSQPGIKDSNIIAHNHDVDRQWFNDVHVVTDQLNFIKETYKAVQMLKKKKLTDGETPEPPVPSSHRGLLLTSSPTKDALMIEDEDEGEVLDEEDNDDEEDEEEVEEGGRTTRRRSRNSIGNGNGNGGGGTASGSAEVSSGNESTVVEQQTFTPLGKRTRRKVQFK